MNEDSNTEKDIIKRILILIIIVLLLYIMAICFGQIKDELIETNADGTVNIYEINFVIPPKKCCIDVCNCKNGCDCLKQNDEENISGEKPVIPKPFESGDKNESGEQNVSGDQECECKPGTGSSFRPIMDSEDIMVYDDDVVYSVNTPLNIFEHSQNNVNIGKIAPGTENIYTFYVKNNNKFDIKYNLSIIEENAYNVNMKYKLKLNGRFISGNENEYVSAKQLNQMGVILNQKNLDEYQLMWKWVDSDNDGEIGRNINANYKLNLVIAAEQY